MGDIVATIRSLIERRMALEASDGCVPVEVAVDIATHAATLAVSQALGEDGRRRRFQAACRLAGTLATGGHGDARQVALAAVAVVEEIWSACERSDIDVA